MPRVNLTFDTLTDLREAQKLLEEAIAKEHLDRVSLGARGAYFYLMGGNQISLQLNQTAQALPDPEPKPTYELSKVDLDEIERNILASFAYIRAVYGNG